VSGGAEVVHGSLPQGRIALRSIQQRILMTQPLSPTSPSITTTSLTVTSKGQVTLRKELLEQATGSIHGFIGLLAGRSSHRATVEELNEAASPVKAFRGQGKKGGSTQRLLDDRLADAALKG
jgi:hypothetical protein